MRTVFCLFLTLTTISQSHADYNYAEALQKAIFFFEAQQSGWLSPNNRVEWRGPSHTDDGQDAGLDLSGGWYDAGDHWKTNTTMAQTMYTMSWAVLEFPQSFEQTGQMDELLENLKYATDYFLKCIVDDSPADAYNFDAFDLYFDIGNSLGPEPSVHMVSCAPEVTNGYTVREALRVNMDAPGPDIAANMSAGLAAASLVFHAHGDPNYAETLYQKAEKLFNFADAFPFDGNTLRDDGVYALTPANTFRKVGYRSDDPDDKMLYACGFMQRAARVFDPDAGDSYLEYARSLYDKIIYEKGSGYFGSWMGYERMSCLMSLLEVTEDENDISIWGKKVFEHARYYNNLPPTPAGFVVQDVWNGTFTLIKGIHEAFYAMLYSNWTTNPTHKTTFINFAKNQMDYALGDNPYNKSYLVGFGDKGWFNSLLHAGAMGLWAGFAHIDQNNSLCLWENRHVLHGGLPGGPDLNDVYEGIPGDWKHNEVTVHSGASVIGVLAGILAQNPTAYEPIPDDKFPPTEKRNLTLDPNNTDREFYVAAYIRSLDETSIKIAARLYNRSSWPARVTDSLSFRCYFTLDNNATPNDIQVTLHSPRVGGYTSPVTLVKDNICYVEFMMPGTELWPNADGNGIHYMQYYIFTIKAPGPGKWNLNNDWSFSGITEENWINLNMPVYENGKLLTGKTPFQSAVDSESLTSSMSITLLPNYPNPFNPMTTIRFKISTPQNVNLTIFNTAGQIVRVLMDRHVSAGSYQINWDGKNESGIRAPSGAYFMRLKADNVSKSQKLLLLK